MENGEIVGFIQRFCSQRVFEKRGEKGRYYDDYSPGWFQFAKKATGQDIRDEKLSTFTHKQIQEAVKKEFGEKYISSERKVGGETQLSFDLYNPGERTAFEICLGAIKNEFEKDILKAMLDSETVTLMILYREYRTGAEGSLYGRKWFEEPAQKAKMELVGRYKTKVLTFPLVPDDKEHELH